MNKEKIKQQIFNQQVLLKLNNKLKKSETHGDKQKECFSRTFVNANDCYVSYN